ncbi:MAG: peptidylprolyl isomerase [bacterium]|nr:peptidylprolyl isomerase [bacterium]
MKIYKKIICITIVLFISSCSVQAEIIEKIVAKINKEVITLLELENVVNNYAKLNKVSVNEQIRKNILNELINDKLILQEAKKQKIFVDPFEINQIIDQVKANFKDQKDFQEVLKNQNLTEEQLQKEHENTLLKIKLIEKDVKSKVRIDRQKIQKKLLDYNFKIRVRHILVAKEDLAREILSKVKNGENFERLAQEHSLCPSKNKEGDLGFFTKGQMVKEFEEAAFSLKEGETSGIVNTKFGYHIIKGIEKEEMSKKELKGISLQIEQQLYEEEYQKELENWLKELWKEAYIEINL